MNCHSLYIPFLHRSNGKGPRVFISCRLSATNLSGRTNSFTVFSSKGSVQKPGSNDVHRLMEHVLVLLSGFLPSKG